MSENNFNMSLRKFLKTVGVTSQTEIEKAVRKAQADGTLPKGPLTAKAVITLEPLGLTHEVDGQIFTQDA
ncbi:MAG: DUF6494 family protein [Rhodobacter sp.]|nr:DUF6494 family protein [Rhodobacter sp.]